MTDADDRRLTHEMNELHGRRFSTPTLVLFVLVSLLVGAILALLALPERDVADEQMALQQAVVEASRANEDLRAANEALQADVAAKDAEIAALSAAAAGDQAAQSTALDERGRALDEREAAMEQREDLLDGRDAAISAAEGGGAAGLDLPSLDDLGNIELPEISEEQARGAFERLIDRLQEIVGVDVPQ